MTTMHDSETRAQGQQVITACAFIHHNIDGIEKLFLPKRAKTKKFWPSVYELPGGHIDFEENIIEGLKREIMEEFGMSIKVGDPFAVFDYLNQVKGSHSVEIIYFAQFIDPIENIKLNPEDHSEYIWFDGDDYTLLDAGGKDDKEKEVIRKGFALLQGKQLEL